MISSFMPYMCFHLACGAFSKPSQSPSASSEMKKLFGWRNSNSGNRPIKSTKTIKKKLWAILVVSLTVGT